MTMKNRFFTAMALLGICLAGTTWAGTVPTGFFYDSNISLEKYSGRSTYFAQNDPKKSSDNVAVDDASKPHKNTKKSKTLTPEKNTPKKTKPMQPFVPSETIPVDQGVDFPYDI